MIEIHQSVFGVLCLIGAGAAQGAASADTFCVHAVVLSVPAAYNLISVTWIPVSETWKLILIGLGLGLLAMLYRDVRRSARYFRGKVCRVTQPYSWYGRYYRRRRRY